MVNKWRNFKIFCQEHSHTLRRQRVRLRHETNHVTFRRISICFQCKRWWRTIVSYMRHWDT